MSAMKFLWLQVLLAVTVSLSPVFGVADNNDNIIDTIHGGETASIPDSSEYAHESRSEDDVSNYAMVDPRVRNTIYDKHNRDNYMDERESNDENLFKEKLKHILKSIPDPKVSELLKIEFQNQDNTLHDSYIRKGGTKLGRRIKAKDYKVITDIIKSGLTKNTFINSNDPDKMKAQMTIKGGKAGNVQTFSIWSVIRKISKHGEDGAVEIVMFIPNLFSKIFKGKGPSKGNKPSSKPKRTSRPKPKLTKPRPNKTKKTSKRTRSRPKQTKKTPKPSKENSEPDYFIPSFSDSAEDGIAEDGIAEDGNAEDGNVEEEDDHSDED